MLLFFLYYYILVTLSSSVSSNEENHGGLKNKAVSEVMPSMQHYTNLPSLMEQN